MKLHTEHGQEVICEARSHVLNYELAMMAWFSGCVARPVAAQDGILTLGADSRGDSSAGAALGADGTDRDREHIQHGGRSCVSAGGDATRSATARTSMGLTVHMDGARVFNAADVPRDAGSGDCGEWIR